MRYVDYEVEASYTNTDGMKPAKGKRKGAIGHILLSPIMWVRDTTKWLTNPTKQGGAKYIMGFAASACLALSIENGYVWFGGARFLPKPGIEDGAQLQRLLPLGDAGNAFVGLLTDTVNLLGAKVQKPQPFQKVDLIVWADPKFYMALGLILAINAIQAVFLRRVSLAVRERQLRQAQETDDRISVAVQSFEERSADRKRLETVVRENQVKNYGNGNVLAMGSIVALAYLFEAWSYFATAVPGTSFIESLSMALVSILGAEVFYSVGDYMDNREE